MWLVEVVNAITNSYPFQKNSVLSTGFQRFKLNCHLSEL